jgi:hypothetical protein
MIGAERPDQLDVPRAADSRDLGAHRFRDLHCERAVATNHGAGLISMSFSADGSTLAWGQDDGIYEANVADPSDCATVTRSVHRVVPGGSMPFLGKASLSRR